MNIMIRSPRYFTLLGFGGLLAIGATACNANFVFDVDGSGVAETTTYDFESFDEIDISSAFQADITIADGPPTVEVTVDDNLVDRLEVKVEDGELEIGMKSGRTSFGVQPTVVITVPELTELELSGATQAIVSSVDTSDLKIDLSGASDALVKGDVTNLIVDGSGASEFRLDGSADALSLDLSGAGSADFTDSPIGSVSIDLSGGSEAEFSEVDEVDGDLSGASTVIVPEETNVNVSASGSSDVERR